MEKERVQWHPGFASGCEYELREYADALVFETEHELNRAPLRVDLLIIKLEKDIRIKKAFGSYFRKHNIIEFKSPHDSLTIDHFFKMIGYVGIYKCSGSKTDEIRIEDITLSLVRATYPRKLIQQLIEYGASIEEENPGIYRVEGMFYLPIRIVVTARLDAAHAALRLLSTKVREQDIREFINSAGEPMNPGDYSNIKAILEVSTQVNRRVFDGAKEEEAMLGPGLSDFMKDELEESKNRGLQEGRREGMERGRECILSLLVSQGKITPEEANELRRESTTVGSV